jgi:hypothetical protein
LDKEYSIYTMDLIPCFSDNKVWLWDRLPCALKPQNLCICVLSLSMKFF